jgi:hypothetical protein
MSGIRLDLSVGTSFTLSEFEAGSWVILDNRPKAGTVVSITNTEQHSLDVSLGHGMATIDRGCKKRFRYDGRQWLQHQLPAPRWSSSSSSSGEELETPRPSVVSVNTSPPAIWSSASSSEDVELLPRHKVTVSRTTLVAASRSNVITMSSYPPLMTATIIEEKVTPIIPDILPGVPTPVSEPEVTADDASAGGGYADNTITPMDETVIMEETIILPPITKSVTKVYTYNVAGTYEMDCLVIGGGGGGADGSTELDTAEPNHYNGGGGGGCGECHCFYLLVEHPNTLTVTVGAGGYAGMSGTSSYVTYRDTIYRTARGGLPGVLSAGGKGYNHDGGNACLRGIGPDSGVGKAALVVPGAENTIRCSSGGGGAGSSYGDPNQQTGGNGGCVSFGADGKSVEYTPAKPGYTGGGGGGGFGAPGQLGVGGKGGEGLVTISFTMTEEIQI